MPVGEGLKMGQECKECIEILSGIDKTFNFFSNKIRDYAYESAKHILSVATLELAGLNEKLCIEDESFKATKRTLDKIERELDEEEPNARVLRDGLGVLEDRKEDFIREVAKTCQLVKEVK